MTTMFDGALAPAFLPVSTPLPAGDLLHLAENWARRLPADVVAEPLAGERSYRLLCTTDTYDVWVVRWSPGSRAGLHEHGRSAGAMVVVDGQLVDIDCSPGRARRTERLRVKAGRGRSFPPRGVHDVQNVSARPATSVHVYSPPLAG